MTEFKAGDRVRAKVEIDRFPHFVVNAGETGTILSITDDTVQIKLDNPPKGSEEWDGCLHYYGVGYDEAISNDNMSEDLELIDG